jgi:polar amino acid transport system substrate-binding protein
VSGTGANAPFHFVDPQTGEQRGITMDLFAAIAADLGMTLDVLPIVPLEEMVPAIQAGVVDAYGGNIAMTPERVAAVAFSDPWYLNIGEGVWVPQTDATDYRSVYDFAGRIIGAQRGSATYRGLAALGIFSEIREYDGQDALARAVIAGEVAAAFLPYDTSAYVLFAGQYPELRLPANYQGSVNYGLLIGTPLNGDDPELVERVNGALARIMADGTLAEIFAGYGLDWRLPTGIR